MRDDIGHQIKFLEGQSLRTVWNIVQAQVQLLPVRTWDRRGDEFRGSPVDFVRQHYGRWQDGEWHCCELTMADIKRDRSLHRRYKQWIRRHPEDDLHLPESNPAPRREPQI